MHTDLPTLSAPIMILGLLIGFSLCFYGYKAKNVLVPLRSVLSGAFVSLTLALLLFQSDSLITALSSETPFASLASLFTNSEYYQFPLIYLCCFSLGGLILFYIARKKGSIIQFIVSIFTAVSMALFLFLLILSFFPLSLSLISSLALLVLLLIYCLKSFDTYIAFETSLGGALLVSYLLARFWFLGFPLFLFWAIILSSGGILNQIHSLNKHKNKEAKANA